MVGLEGKMSTLLNNSLKQFASISVFQFMIMVFTELAVLTLVLVLVSKRTNKEIRLTDIASFFCLIVYVNIIMQLTLLGRKDGSRIGVELSLFKYLGESAFSRQMLMYAVLNVLLFVPYGFIVSWLPWFRKQKACVSILLTTMVCLASSLLIEMVQLITERGYYELEDLVCNTLGGLIGSLLYAGFIKCLMVIQENRR